MRAQLQHAAESPHAHGVCWRVASLLILLAASVVSSNAVVQTTGKEPVARAHAKLARDLHYNKPDQLINVIVQFRVTPRAEHYARMANRGAQVRTKLHSIHAAAFQLPASAIAELEKDPDILYVSPDRTVSLTSASTPTYESAVQADVAATNYSVDGTGIGVAVIDSGVSDHKDIHGTSATRVVHSESFVSGVTATADAYGHGTHVAGIIAGNAAASGAGSGYANRIPGMAPNANIINLRVLDQNGAGTDSQVIAAIQRAIALQSQYNIRIINLSLGRPVYESYTLDPLCQAVEQAWKAGIVVVVAAGNSGRDNSHGTNGFGTIGAPGNDPAVITVGATRLGSTIRVSDTIASYSSKGPTLVDHIVKPDLVAPGNRIVSLLSKGSTLDVNNPGLEDAPDNPSACPGTCPTSYFRLSGTSMSTPVVSGAVALMLQKYPSLTPDTVKARLMKTAWKGFTQYSSSYDDFNNRYDNQYDLFTYGAGYLDVNAALGSTDVANGLALSPTAVYNSKTGTISIVNTTLGTGSALYGTSVVWGNSVLWGTSVVWGNCTLLANSVVWGSSVVWGNVADTGFSVVWGSSVSATSTSATSAFSDGQDGEN